MPVPLPPDGTDKRTPPDAIEARAIAGGVAAAVAPTGGLTGLQRMLIEAVTDAMTGFVVPAVSVPRLGPTAFARVMADRNLGFRQRMIHFILLCALVLDPLPEEVADRAASYAQELGVDESMLRIARDYARGSLGLALVDFQRSGYMETWDPAHAEPLQTSKALSDAWEQCTLDPDLAARWAALRTLDPGTLGRQVADFYDARGFSLLAMVVSLFETGYMASGAGLFEYDRGHLSHEGMAVRLADAMRRGALCGAHSGGPDLLRIDWFERADRPVDDVRAEIGVVPKSEVELEAGSVGPWEKGGISPFQFEAGRRAAESERREYVSFGATPS